MSLHVSIIAPDRNVWDANAEEVILPSSTGQLGILKLSLIHISEPTRPY